MPRVTTQGIGAPSRKSCTESRLSSTPLTASSASKQLRLRLRCASLSVTPIPGRDQHGLTTQGTNPFLTYARQSVGMVYTTEERIAHVYRRLGIGAYPDLVATTSSIEAAITRALDLDEPSPDLFEMEVPTERENATDIAMLAAPVQSWITSMVKSGRLIEERMVWFWHDHFATAIQKVRVPYLLWRQHLTLRQHATGSFRELLGAIATDPRDASIPRRRPKQRRAGQRELRS